jgi:hypothetical protein
LNPSTKFAASLDFEHLDMIDLEPPFGNQIFSHSLSIGSVGRKIASDTASLFMRVQPVDRVDILGKISYGDLSDGNQRLSWFGEIDYTLLKKPLLQAGYSYYYLHYSDPAAIYTEGARAIPAYYDPKNFEAHTVKVKLIHDFSPQWQFGIEQRFSHVPKSDGFATGTFAFLNYSFDEKNSIRLDGRYFYQSRGVNRNGLGPSFDAAAFTLSYQLRF